MLHVVFLITQPVWAECRANAAREHDVYVARSGPSPCFQLPRVAMFQFGKMQTAIHDLSLSVWTFADAEP